MKLADFVYPDIKAARSVNLERDRGSSSAFKEYQITEKARGILKRFVASLQGEKVSAWSLTGPYGMGKSAFANYLVALTGSNVASETLKAYQKLGATDSELNRTLSKTVEKATGGKGFIRIPVTAAYEPINKTLISGIMHSLNNGQLDRGEKESIKNVIERVRTAHSAERADSKEISEVIQALNTTLNRPVLIIIDEFGKNLEYTAHHPDKGDIFIMQMLAETSDVYLWVCLHQAFEGYASGLNVHQRQEWNKVQGRFEDISFVESTAQMLSMVKRVLRHKRDSVFQGKVFDWTKLVSEQIRALDSPLLEGLQKEDIAALYPIHPIAAVMLPELCRRFAQNDRTLFSFLCSGDPFALPAYLQSNSIDEHLPSLGPQNLYDYFFTMSATTFINRPEAQRWVEIQDIIGRANALPPISTAILKTVGVLNLISGHYSLPASPKVLQASLTNTFGIDNKSLDSEIESLSARKTLIFREYAGEFRLWEGSDFDIIGAITERKSKLATRPLAETLQKYCRQSDLIASRHSYTMGTIRSFECRWMALSDLQQSAPVPTKGYDGLIVYTYGNHDIDAVLPPACADQRPLLVAHASHEQQIRELALEAAAAVSVLSDTPELVHDGVARKEAKFRVKASEEQLRLYVEQIYSPGSCEVKWYSDGRQHPVRDFRDVSSLISTLCDRVYCDCPKIGIEMINCELLSGSAARARREVAEAMVTKEGIEMLGFTGFGPEVAIYRTLFRQTGLHKLVDDNWQFSKPDGRSQPAMSTIWKALEEMLRPTENSSDGINVEDMIRHFKEPPFGIRQGPIPLFICHYLMVNSDIIALYQEGAYKPYFGEAEISLMVKRPELFSLRRYAPSGLSRDVVQAYLQVLNVDSAGFGADVRNPSLLKIVIPLLRFVEGLPTYTRFTRRISTRAQKLRGAILNSREPIDLLYQSIPAALDVKPIDGSDVLQKGWKENLRAHLLEGLTELNDAYKRLNEQIQNAVMVAFGYKSGEIALPAFRKATIKLIRPLVPACRDGELKPILGAMASDVSEDNDWVRGIAGQVIKKPLDQWHDSDIDPFLTQIVDIADRIEGMGSILAAGAGVAENGSNVLSIIRADGTAYRQVIKLTDSTAKDLIKRYPEIFDQPDKTKAVLAALLFDSLQIGK